MRPTPAELVANLRRILRDVVEPDLGSDYARARLREVRGVLAQVDWDDAGLDLARDTEALRVLLTECASWAGADEERRTHFVAQLPDLASVAAERPAELTDRFADHNTRHTRYAGVAVALVDPFAVWLRAHPDDTTAAALNRRLLDT